MKSCPICKIPICSQGATYVARHEGVEFVFMVCRRCVDRLACLPTGSKLKNLNRAADAVANNPDKHPHRAFYDLDQARAYAGLAGDPATSAEVVADLLA